MELELQHRTLEGYQPVFEGMFGQEETLESIVPDFCPDVARIVSASGKVFLKEKETGEGTLRMTGTVCVTVLYIPEGDDFARALDITVPFQCVKDCPQIHEGMSVRGTVTVAFSDAKILNPRKILVRSSLSFSATVYGLEKCQLTCDAAGNAEDGVEKQFSQHKNCMISEVAEKIIIFSDVLRQSASKPAIEELLCSRAEVGAMEAKIIGKKLVCKGELLLTVLYRNAGMVVSSGFELPYSQIIDLMTVAEEGEPELSVVLRNMDCRLRDGELEVSVEAWAQGAVWVRHPVTVMSDMYCTDCPVEVDRVLRPLCTEAEQGARKEPGRQFCPSGIPGKQVLDCCAAVGDVLVEKGESGQKHTAQINVDILYLSEDDALCGVNYTIPVSCDISVPKGSRCSCTCRPVGAVTAVPVTGGLEVRFEVEFKWMLTRQSEVLCVSALKQGAPAAGNEVRPSVVVRMVGEGESLWEIAKACNSRVKDICMANSLPSETVSAGTVLLIPSKRV